MQVLLENDEFFVEGGVPVASLTEILSHWGAEVTVGAHCVFLGQVRADEHPEGIVTAIEFSAHRSVAEKALHALISRVVSEHTCDSVHLFLQHGLGVVPVGSLPVIVAVASGHRAEAFAICRGILEALKSEVPIYGKELFGDEGHRWKVNA